MSIETEDTHMLTRKQIIDACKTLHPKPEHGARQYGVVIDHLADECGEDLFEMSLDDAVANVMAFMNMGIAR